MIFMFKYHLKFWLLIIYSDEEKLMKPKSEQIPQDNNHEPKNNIVQLTIDKCEFRNSVVTLNECDILLLQEALLTNDINDIPENITINFNAIIEK